MSFIKVKDPRKREELVRDFIETRKRIKDNFIARKVGEAEYQTGLTKLFKPVTETQKATTKEITDAQKATAEKITKELLPIQEGLKKLPTVISLPQYQAIEEYKKEKNLGPTVIKALNYIKPEDKTTFGMYFKDGDFRIGDKKADIKDDDIIIDGITYKGTDGLWELIMKDEPQEGIYTDEDFLNYGRILKQTNAIYQGNNPNQNKPKSSKSTKWKYLIKPIWENIKKQKDENETETEDEEEGNAYNLFDDDPQPGTSGSGLKILPSDPNALIDRFDLLFSSKKAGHTGVRNEIVAILDELKRQGVINVQDYKKLNRIIKK